MSGSGFLLATAVSSALADQIRVFTQTDWQSLCFPLKFHKPRFCPLNILILQAPTEQLPKLGTLNGFSSPKFQSLPTILPKTHGQVFHSNTALLGPAAVLATVSIAVRKHHDQAGLSGYAYTSLLIIKGSQGKQSNRDLEADTSRGHGGGCLLACSACFPIEPRTTAQRRHHLQWAGPSPINLSLRKCPPGFRPAQSYGGISQLGLLPVRCLASVKLT